MDKNVQKELGSLNKRIDAFATQSKDHFKILQELTIDSLLFAALHAQAGPLNRLYNEVNSADAEGIRLFLANVKIAHSISYQNDAGEDKLVFFLSASRDNGIAMVERNDTNRKAIQKSCESVIKLGKDGLSDTSKYPFGRADRKKAAEDTFNEAQSVKRLLMTLSRNGSKALAIAISRASKEYLGAMPLSVADIEKIAKDNDLEAKAKELSDKLEATNKKLAARREREATGNPIPVPAENAAQPAVH